MNLSGESVGELVRFYKIDIPTQLLVISDDVDMDFGRIRIRKAQSRFPPPQAMRYLVGRAVNGAGNIFAARNTAAEI